MKKISAVLLVLVLVGSVAFAGFTGSAAAEFGFNLEDSSYGFDNITKANIDVKLMEALGAAKGEGDIYADISASLSLSFANANEGDLNPATLTWGLAIDDDEVLAPLYVKFAFDHAKIVGDGWSVGILGALEAPNFASSAIDTWKQGATTTNKWGYKVDKKTFNADLKASKILSDTAGLEVALNDYTFGVGLVGDLDDDYYHLYGALKTPAYELGDGLTAQFGAAGVLVDNDPAVTPATNAASGSAKIAYATDEYSASVAADIVYDDELMAEVAVAAAYDIVSLDAYFATNGMYDGKFTNKVIEDLLSVKAVVDLDPMTVTLKGMDLLNAKDVYGSVAYVVNESLEVAAGAGYVIEDEELYVDGSVTYTADQYEAYASLDWNITTEVLNMVVGVESTTLVAGATLYAEWDSDAIAGNLLNEKFGTITVGAKIAF